MQFEWKYAPNTIDFQQDAEELANKISVSITTARLLIRRGVTTVSGAKRFIAPKFDELHDPFLMKDMDVAVDRLNDAIIKKERIMICGDYDVDGCTAVAVVYNFILQFYSNIEFYIPDRYEEGYGISQKCLDHAFQAGIKLIIVLDCGMKAIKEIAKAKTMGIDFIVCDHHEPGSKLPPAVAILNPKRRDNTYPCVHLSGCCIGFKFMQAFARNNNIPFYKLSPFLDLCAVSIATDMVPVVGECRTIAYHGLGRLNQNPSIGLSALIEVCGLVKKKITMSDIVFKIGPRINASGRMQSGMETVNLLVEKNYENALEKANNINACNEQRKGTDKKMMEEAMTMVKKMKENDREYTIVVAAENWKKGIIGILASRIADIYYRSTAVLAIENDMATGSIRGIGDFDVHKAVSSCADLLENYGGHTYAVGLTMKAKNIEEFTQRFKDLAKKYQKEKPTIPVLNIEKDLDFRDITKKLHFDLKKLAPFGPGNPKPLFRTRNVYDYGTSKVVGKSQDHIKLEMVDSKSGHILNGIAFGQSTKAKYIKSKHPFDIVYSIEDNAFKQGEIQLLIEDIRPTE